MSPAISKWIPILALALLAGCSRIEGNLLYHPSHHSNFGILAPWVAHGEAIGCARVVGHPRTVWLMTHGNAGQACDRAYALGHFPATDAVFVLEYPGFGSRAGRPTKASIGAAVIGAYRRLRADYPGVPVCVLGESLGSGPACALAHEAEPPNKIVLVVPFDRLSAAARDHFPGWMVSVLAVDDWDNVAALQGYRGKVVIYGARRDGVIPVRHAQALAAGVPGAELHLEDCGHNDWSNVSDIAFQYP